MPEAPLPNTAEARTETGELKDQGAPPSPTSTQETKTEPTKTEGEAPKPAGAPDAYTTYTAPEGYTPDAKATEAANTVFKDLGLSQDQAQKVMDLAFARDLALQKQQTGAIAQMHEDWGNQLKSDRDIGSKLPQVQAEIGKALDLLTPTTRDNFKAAMDATAVGNHPAFVKAFYELAQKVNEGKHVSGAPAAPTMNGRPSAAQSMYPNLPS